MLPPCHPKHLFNGLLVAEVAPADAVDCGAVGKTKIMSQGDAAHELFFEGTGSEAEWAAMIKLTGDTCDDCEIEKACIPFPAWSPLGAVQHYSVPVPNSDPVEHHGHAVVLKDSLAWLTCSKCE